MMKSILILFFITYTQNLLAKPTWSCRHSNTIFRCVEYISNYDGDTITFNISNIHSLFGKNIRVRVQGIDTPELKGKTSCEKAKARKTQKFVQNALKKAKNIELHNVKRGKYFRIVADVIVDGKSIARELLEQKLAIAYGGEKKRKVNWCK